MMMCGHCFRAQKPQTVYSTHNIEDCNNLTRDQKMRLLGSMARALDVENTSKDDDDDDDLSLEDLTDGAGNLDL